MLVLQPELLFTIHVLTQIARIAKLRITLKMNVLDQPNFTAKVLEIQHLQLLFQLSLSPFYWLQCFKELECFELNKLIFLNCNNYFMEAEENSLNEIEVNEEETDANHQVKKQRKVFKEYSKKEVNAVDILEVDASLIASVERHLFSRLLYTNPVCLLTSYQKERKNIMTISWLTPVNNKVCLFIKIKNKGNFCLFDEQRKIFCSNSSSGKIIW